MNWFADLVFKACFSIWYLYHCAREEMNEFLKDDKRK